MTVTRRRLLTALAAAGGAGALRAPGTAARLADREAFEALLQSGAVDLQVDYEILGGPGADDPELAQGTIDGPRIQIPIGTLDAAGMAGSTLVTFALPQRADAVNNPVSLWLAADCPTPAGTGLSESVQVTLSTADCETGAPIERLAQGSLREIGEQLQTGLQVDGDPTTEPVACLTDVACVLFEYELGGYVGTETVDLPLWFGAVQCRHGDQTNPFANRDPHPCEPADPCPCCRTLGKLEFEGGTQDGLEEGFVVPGTYAFTEGDTSYGLEIYDTADKPEEDETVGVAFRLVRVDDPAAPVPTLCTVAVKGGTGFVEYERDDQTRGDTASLPDGDADGLVFAPEGRAISHVTVCVCTTEAEADCPGCTDPSLDGPGSGVGTGGGQ